MQTAIGMVFNIQWKEIHMKAYQLKIVIKNSKPPIWRRCIVPAGITFSQLSIILNKVMGWSGYHLSEFEFYHLQLQLREEDEFDDFVPMWDYDLLDSSKTFINEYMEQQEWFTYTYDFGDDWQHRVTIEKIIKDYPLNYPQVLKFKGDCPMEDCGGIWGYYECIDVMEDPDNPESSDRRIWAESQGYGISYDMDEVNEDLQETCYIIFGKGDKRKQSEIYEDMSNDKCGLYASKTAKNNVPKIQAQRHKQDEMLQQMAGMIGRLAANKSLQEKMKNFDESSSEQELTGDLIPDEIRQHIAGLFPKNRERRKIQLADLLNSYGKEDLRDLASIYHLRGVSSLKKAELIHKLKEKMLLPETIQETFMVLMDDAIHTFERIAECESDYYISEREERLLQYLVEMGYVEVYMDNLVDIPEDVIEGYNQVNTEQFKNLRQRISWLLICFDAATWFYGAVPAEIMVKVVNRRKGWKYDCKTLLSDYNRVPANQKDFVLIGELFVHKNLMEKELYKHLIKRQGDKDYYIPTEDEIRDINMNQFIMNDPQVRRLLCYFTDKLNMPENEAISMVRDIQHNINGGCDMHDIFDMINENGVCFNEAKDINEFVPIINDLWNNTRMLANRGFKPNELSELRRDMFPFGPGNMPTIIPGSSSAAKLLMEGRDEIERMGFPVDFDANATEVPVYSMPSGINGSVEVKTKKVYPNDPCPCGSGKKYKKCCGR